MKKNDLIRMRLSEENRNYIKYKNLALDVFRWEGLPNGIQSRHIEEQLFEHGRCFFYNNKALGLICLPCYDSTSMNIYGDYEQLDVFSINGIVNERHNIDDGVQIWNNDLKEPTKGYIKDYADRMSQVELSIRMNVHQQKFPYFIACDKKSENSWRQMYDRIDLGEPAIFHNADLNVENIQVLPTTSPYVVDKLNEYRFELERELLSFLGINNNFEKAERLVVDEVNSNNEFIKRNIEIQFKHREQACEQINKMFGLNVKVIKVSDLVEDQMKEDQEEDQEEENKDVLLDK